MAATIVQHNKSQSVVRIFPFDWSLYALPQHTPKDLLLHTETLLRAALVRFDVGFETLNRLLHVTSTLYRRSKTLDLNGAETPTNLIATGILDVLSDALKGKVRVLPSTMTAILQVCDALSTSISLTNL